VHPHVSHRPYVYQFPLGLDAAVPADWALLDVTTNTDMAPGDLRAKVDEMLADGWGVVDAEDGFLLLSKSAADKEIPAKFYSFMRLSQTDRVEDRPWQLLGVEAEDWARWRQTKLAATWQIDAGFNPALGAPDLAVITPGGETVATLATAAPPGLAWLPPAAWKPGERIRLTTLPLTLPRIFGIRADGADEDMPALFVRRSDDTLVKMDVPSRDTDDLGATLATYLGPLAASEQLTATLPDGRELTLRGWLPDGGGAAGPR
jgi:hypothetical protein